MNVNACNKQQDIEQYYFWKNAWKYIIIWIVFIQNSSWYFQRCHKRHKLKQCNLLLLIKYICNSQCLEYLVNFVMLEWNFWIGNICRIFGSCVVIGSVIHCRLIPLVNILIGTWSTSKLILGWHSIDTWSTFGDSRRLTADSYASIENKSIIEQLSMEMLINCWSSVNQGVDGVLVNGIDRGYWSTLNGFKTKWSAYFTYVAFIMRI